MLFFFFNMATYCKQIGQEEENQAWLSWHKRNHFWLNPFSILSLATRLAFEQFSRLTVLKIKHLKGTNNYCRAKEFAIAKIISYSRSVAQWCLTLWYLVVCSPPGEVHGILQARILEWVAIPFSRGFSQPRNWTRVSDHLLKTPSSD